MTRYPVQRLTRVALLPLAAFGALTLSACGTTTTPASAGDRPPAADTTPASSGPAGKPVVSRTASGAGTNASQSTSGTNDSAATLPDGIHRGFVTAVNTAKPSISFDKIEVLTGEAGRKAYQKANPGATDGPDNDYWLVNDNKLVRTVPVSADVKVGIIDLAKGVDPVPTSFDKLPAFVAHNVNHFWFRLTIKGGRVTSMSTEYHP